MKGSHVCWIFQIVWIVTRNFVLWTLFPPKLSMNYSSTANLWGSSTVYHWFIEKCKVEREYVTEAETHTDRMHVYLYVFARGREPETNIEQNDLQIHAYPITDIRLHWVLWLRGNLHRIWKTGTVWCHLNMMSAFIIKQIAVSNEHCTWCVYFGYIFK